MEVHREGVALSPRHPPCKEAWWDANRYRWLVDLAIDRETGQYGDGHTLRLADAVRIAGCITVDSPATDGSRSHDASDYPQLPVLLLWDDQGWQDEKE